MLFLNSGVQCCMVQRSILVCQSLAKGLFHYSLSEVPQIPLKRFSLLAV